MRFKKICVNFVVLSRHVLLRFPIFPFCELHTESHFVNIKTLILGKLRGAISQSPSHVSHENRDQSYLGRNHYVIVSDFSLGYGTKIIFLLLGYGKRHGQI